MDVAGLTGRMGPVRGTVGAPFLPATQFAMFAVHPDGQHGDAAKTAKEIRYP